MQIESKNTAWMFSDNDVGRTGGSWLRHCPDGRTPSWVRRSGMITFFQCLNIHSQLRPPDSDTQYMEMSSKYLVYIILFCSNCGEDSRSEPGWNAVQSCLLNSIWWQFAGKIFQKSRVNDMAWAVCPPIRWLNEMTCLGYKVRYSQQFVLFGLLYFLLFWGFRDKQPPRPFTCSQLHAHAGASRGGGWGSIMFLPCALLQLIFASSLRISWQKSTKDCQKGQNKWNQYQDRRRFHAHRKDVSFTRPPIRSCLWRWSLLCLHQRRSSQRQCSHHNWIFF